MMEDASLNIEIYFSLKPILSMIMNYITPQFGQLVNNQIAADVSKHPIGFIYHNKPKGLQILSVEELSQFLSHRKIAVASEDEVVSCVMEWFQTNIHKLTNEEILQIIYHINWPYVSFDKLMTIFRTFPALRSIQ